jgi:hypothetical protein
MTIIGLKINAASCHAPLTMMKVGVYATQHCNLKCKCCTAFSPLAEKSFLNLDSFKKDMSKLAELTNHNLELFYVTGGEPLLHPQISDIFNIARSFFQTASMSILTNGLLLLKMPDQFWETCRSNKVEINISRYPINIDMDQIKLKAEDYGIKLTFVGGEDAPIKLMWKYPLDLEGNQPLIHSYNLCTQINTCVTINEGKLFPCNTIAGIRHFNKFFDKNLKVSPDDVLDIEKVNDINEVFAFLSASKPFCRYCNRKGLVLGIPYGKTQFSIDEWV